MSVRAHAKVPAKSGNTGWSSRRALVFAALAVLFLRELMPLGHFFLYPFTLLATWVHEMGHGLAAICVGGHFSALEIFSDASGLAHTSEDPGIKVGVVAAAGLVAPPIAGALVLAFARGPRRTKIVLWVLAAALALSLFIWVRSLAGWLAMPVVIAAIVYASLRFSDNRRLLFAQFIGLLLGLDTISRLDYLFAKATLIDGELRASDTATVAASWGGNYFLWGMLLAAVSLAFVAVGLWASWRKKRERAALPRNATKTAPARAPA